MEFLFYKFDMCVMEIILNYVNILCVFMYFMDVIFGDVIGRVDCDFYEIFVSILD